MLHGDFGYSFEYQLPVSEVVGDRLWLTILVSFVTIIFTWIIAFPIGIYSATHQYSWSDFGLTFVGLIGIAMPNFMLALILMYFANIWFGTSIGASDGPEIPEPADELGQGEVDPGTYLDPGASSSAPPAPRHDPEAARQPARRVAEAICRSTARAKGLHPFKTLIKYPLRMSLNFFISDIGSILPAIISGAEITAVVLSLETTGPMLIKALAEPGHVSGRLVPDVPGIPDRDRRADIRYRAGLPRPTHPAAGREHQMTVTTPLPKSGD